MWQSEQRTFSSTKTGVFDPNLVAHNCNPSTQEVEAGRLSELQSKF